MNAEINLKVKLNLTNLPQSQSELLKILKKTQIDILNIDEFISHVDISVENYKILNNPPKDTL